MLAFVAENFWTLLVVSSIAAAGFMVSGHAVLDEILLAALLVLGFLAARRGLVPLRSENKTKLHYWLFLFTVSYFLIESFRGTIFVGDVRILRWVGYYLLFAGFLWLIWRWRFPVPSSESTAKIVGWASSAYFGIYSLIGLVSEFIFNVWRWAPQGMLWAGSAYAVFPILFSFPAGTLLLRSEDKKTRRLGWLTLFLSVFSIAYYESRIGWLVLLGMLILIPFTLGLRRTFKAVSGLIAIFGFSILFALSPVATNFSWQGQLKTPADRNLSFQSLTDPSWYKVRFNSFIGEVGETAVAPLSPRLTDLDRSLHLKAAFAAAEETPLQFLVGGGTYSHRLLLRPYLVDAPPVIRTVGWSAILVDFGIFGFALVVLNLFFVVKAILPSRQFILIFAALAILPWLAVSDLQDSMIYFWSLMPLNLFLFLSRQGSDIL